METLAGPLDKMKDHLVTKNVAISIAEKLCESVASKLEGKVIGTFTGMYVRRLASSLLRILRGG